jgi:hypothetical protein
MHARPRTADTRIFQTELLSLDIAGAPAGVMLRESPSRPSLGQTTVRAIEGGFRIGSFFDVFIELSTDGGQTWSGVANPVHIELNPQPFPP